MGSTFISITFVRASVFCFHYFLPYLWLFLTHFYRNFLPKFLTIDFLISLFSALAETWGERRSKHAYKTRQIVRGARNCRCNTLSWRITCHFAVGKELKSSTQITFRWWYSKRLFLQAFDMATTSVTHRMAVNWTEMNEFPNEQEIHARCVKLRFLTAISHRGLRNGFIFRSQVFPIYFLDFHYPFLFGLLFFLNSTT